jgi:hypothetical protein
MHAVGDCWFSTREAWCGGAVKMASEIAHNRAPASAGGTVHLAQVSRASREKIGATLKNRFGTQS